MVEASRPNWKTYRFDEIAIEIKDRIEVPRESGFDRYVGLTHLDSGSLRIWRWGSTEDVEKQKMLFKSGDIIFGRRNAYLRRVSVAHFDGVCSAHAMVLRAQPEVASQDFLPFFMQTEIFWQAALRNSAGSLSPTINWSNIAKEEFALPPLEEQRQIAEVLQAAETNRNALASTATAAALAYQATCKNLFVQGREAKATNTLGDVADVKNGMTPRRNRVDYWGTDIPWLPTGKVNERRIKHADEFITQKALDECSLRVMPAGSTLVAMVGQGATRGRTALLEFDATINQNFAAITPRKKILPSFLYYQLDALYEALRNWSHGSNQKALNCRLVREFPIWVPDEARQCEITTSLDQMSAAQESLANRELIAEEFKNELLRMYLDGAGS